MKKDVNDLKKLTQKIMNGDVNFNEKNTDLTNKIYQYDEIQSNQTVIIPSHPESNIEPRTILAQEIEAQESLSLQEKEIEMIKNALEKHRGKRKGAAEELGISERTLYRKIKQYDL